MTPTAFDVEANEPKGLIDTGLAVNTWGYSSTYYVQSKGYALWFSNDGQTGFVFIDSKGNVIPNILPESFSVTNNQEGEYSTFGGNPAGGNPGCYGNP